LCIPLGAVTSWKRKREELTESDADELTESYADELSESDAE